MSTTERLERRISDFYRDFVRPSGGPPPEEVGTTELPSELPTSDSGIDELAVQLGGEQDWQGPYGPTLYFVQELDELANRIHRWSRHQGFSPVAWDDGLLAKLALMVGEIGEAIKCYQQNDIAGFCEEMSDVEIYWLDIMAALGLPIASAVATKMAKNERRPHRHGRRNAESKA